jgi:probable F420-dependent oxidoreductase
LSVDLELDPTLRAGLMLGGGSPSQITTLARRVEAVGFDSIFVGDHVSFHVPIIESLTLLSYLAASTERVSLGTAVYLMPLRHPTTTAKVTATVDTLSGGRLIFGVGVGGEFPPEFDAVGVPLKERGTRTDEAIEIVRRLWSEERVEHHGPHFSLSPVSIAPRPVQPGGPPIWVGGRRAPAFRRAGRLGNGYISHMTDADRYAANLEVIASAARDAGRTPLPFGTAALLFTALDDVYENALDRAAKILQRVYNVPFREAASRYCLLGRPEDCLEQLKRFVDAGCRHVLFSPLGDPAEFVEQAREELLPGVHALL